MFQQCLVTQLWLSASLILFHIFDDRLLQTTSNTTDSTATTTAIVTTALPVIPNALICLEVRNVLTIIYYFSLLGALWKL